MLTLHEFLIYQVITCVLVPEHAKGNQSGESKAPAEGQQNAKQDSGGPAVMSQAWGMGTGTPTHSDRFRGRQRWRWDTIII